MSKKYLEIVLNTTLSNTLLSDEFKLIYVATPKAACTTVKWWFAKLLKADDTIRQDFSSSESNQELKIHDIFAKIYPEFADVSKNILVNALNNPEYLAFSFVRNPYSRIFSAWQSKILLKEPIQFSKYSSFDFAEMPYSNAAEIAFAFEHFLEHISEYESPEFRDVHWTPQFQHLLVGSLENIQVSKLEEPQDLIKKIARHLPSGITNPLAFKTTNESLIPYSQKLLTKRSIELIRNMYTEDFHHFQYADEPPPGQDLPSPSFLANAAKAISMIRSRHLRLIEIKSYLHDSITEKNQKLSELGSAIQERDQWLSDAKSAIDERDGRLIQLGQEIEQKISQNNQLREVTTGREMQIANLESAVIQSDETLCHLNQIVSMRDQQVGALNEALSTRDAQLCELAESLEILSGRIAERDTQISVLTEAISVKDARLGELVVSLETLSKSAAERDMQIGDLNEALFTRDARISELVGSLEALSKSIVDRDLRIEELNASILHRDAQIRKINEDNAQKENQLNLLSREISEQKAAIKSISEKLSESKFTIDKITSSLRWRATQPIELFKGMHNGMKKRLKKYALAVRTYTTHRASGVFDPVWYMENNSDVRSAGMSPWRHFLFFGIMENRAPRSDFDPHAYLRLNADVASSHLGAVEHYMTFGWKEERTINEPSLEKIITAYVNHYRPQLVYLDKSKKTVLLVTHEISRTGAPILVLNLAEKLRKYYTVIVLSMGGGTLIEEFTNACDLFIGPLMEEAGGQDFLSGFLRGVKELHDIDSAVVNSIVSTPILKPLWENEIPAAHLIHEFSSYTRPKTIFQESALYSTNQIFSSELIQNNAKEEFPYISNKKTLVLPDARCIIQNILKKTDDIQDERNRLDKALHPQGSQNKPFVVVGVGTVQFRKGVDIFIECAHKVSKLKSDVPIRFVWIGSGYDKINDLAYSCYLEDQIKRSGLESMCEIADETKEVEYLYEKSDLLLISSRLDPLPMVGKEMMSYGKPVICFEKSTGHAEYFKKNKDTASCVIPYFDTESAASKIVELANDLEKYIKVGTALKVMQSEFYNIEEYTNKIKNICENNSKENITTKKELEIIKNSNLIDLKYNPIWLEHKVSAEKVYMAQWSSGMMRRKPFPGFHPGIYAERNQISHGDPFAAYIRQGKPEGPWIQEVITPEEVTDEDLKKVLVPTALHLHLYYTDMADDILARIARCKSRPELLISVSHEVSQKEVEESLLKYGLKAKRMAIVPNRGRDIGPLLTEFGREITDNYEIIGHIHSKKSELLKNSDFSWKWANFLYGNLLGNEGRMMDTILKKMGENPSIGLVYPDDPYVVGWGENKMIAQNLLNRMKILNMELYENINFPVGTMFWARTKALQPLFDLKLEWGDYPQEPLPYDGSMLHAIERILPIIVEKNSFKASLISNPSQKR